MTWVHSECNTLRSHGDAVRYRSIAYFHGVVRHVVHSLNLFVVPTNGGMRLKLRFTKEDLTLGGREQDDLTLPTILQCDKWHLVGFSMSYNDGASIFANPTGSVKDGADAATFKTNTDWKARDKLHLMPKLSLLGALDLEFDDVRVFTGRVQLATFRCLQMRTSFLVCTSSTRATFLTPRGVRLFRTAKSRHQHVR